jgi:hypothetical protein
MDIIFINTAGNQYSCGGKPFSEFFPKFTECLVVSTVSGIWSKKSEGTARNFGFFELELPEAVSRF